MSSTSHSESKARGILSLPLVRDLLIIGLLMVIVWKLLSAEVKIDLASFSFNDFLALVLALFSVALSVAFYFKANEASNQFYDNTYKFTKDMSEILGRIEAGFGEKLRHLDEGYSGVRDRLDRIPHYGATPSEVKSEEEEIIRKEQEQRALIEELAEKAKLAEHEKKELFANLEEKHKELERAKNELRKMQSDRNSSFSEVNQNTVLTYVTHVLKDYIANKLDKNENRRLTRGAVERLFMENRQNIADQAIIDMKNLDLLDDYESLTPRATSMLYQRLLNSN
ncbi:hypothetical protein [Aeromonas sp. A600556]|uniref:hypothetical protein n=1 Tax=Aeromonas sp. A600556 TaxID=2712058 RepID=UPI003A37FAD8